VVKDYYYYYYYYYYTLPAAHPTNSVKALKTALLGLNQTGTHKHINKRKK